MAGTKPVVPVLVAPTASGKTAALLRLADGPSGRGLEVVSADALQVYRGFDVGTAKPTAAERARVPHHLVDVADPDTPMDVTAWVTAAEAALSETLERGARPLVVGGTGFYLDALERGRPTTPPADPASRAGLEAELAARGLLALVAELRAASPADAERAQSNPRRVLRALEVLRASGRPPSSFPRRPPRFELRAFVAIPSAASLDARIADRVDAMLAAGWLDEVAVLVATVPPNAPAWQAIGYAELAGVVRGETDLASARDAVILATRRYAKRQRTWFTRRPAAAVRAVGTLDDLSDEWIRWFAGPT
jgi:tRNA dimethylallyltransferase